MTKAVFFVDDPGPGLSGFTESLIAVKGRSGGMTVAGEDEGKTAPDRPGRNTERHLWESVSG